VEDPGPLAGLVHRPPRDRVKYPDQGKSDLSLRGKVAITLPDIAEKLIYRKIIMEVEHGNIQESAR
jgi:hypothetical protein